MAILTSDRTRAEQLTEDAKRRLGFEDRTRSEQLADDAKRLLGMSDPAATERASEALEEARERLADRLEHLTATLDVASERLGDELAARTEQARVYLEENVDEETMRVWGRGLLIAFVGFLLGYLLGRRKRSRRDDDLWLDEPVTTSNRSGLAQAPSTHGVGAPVR